MNIGSCHCEVKGLHSRLRNFSKLLGLVFLVLQPRSDTLEGYNYLAGAALLCRPISMGFFSCVRAIGGVVFP